MVAGTRSQDRKRNGTQVLTHRVDSCLANTQFIHRKAGCILQRSTLSLSWNRPLFLAHLIPLPTPITAGDVLMKFPAVTLQK